MAHVLQQRLHLWEQHSVAMRQRGDVVAPTVGYIDEVTARFPCAEFRFVFDEKAVGQIPCSLLVGCVGIFGQP